MSVPEKLQFTGGIADLYSRLGETGKEIPFWEELCRLAESDLSRLGLMALDEDILRTGFDFLRLDVPIETRGNLQFQKSARASRKHFREAGNHDDVEQLLTRDNQVCVGKYKGQRLYVN